MYDENLITAEQLEELEKKAEELNAFIKKMKRKNRLTDYVKLRPLNAPENILDDAPVFGFANIMIGTLGIVFANLQNYYTKIAVNSIWIQLITGATKNT